MTQALVWDASALHHAIAADRVDAMGDLASPWRNVSTAALWLFVEAVHAGRIALNGASGLVNTLIEHGARYPAKIKAEGFAAWARAQKLV